MLVPQPYPPPFPHSGILHLGLRFLNSLLVSLDSLSSPPVNEAFSGIGALDPVVLSQTSLFHPNDHFWTGVALAFDVYLASPVGTLLLHIQSTSSPFHY